MLERMAECLAEVEGGSTVLIGFSGGVDSMLLMALCAEVQRSSRPDLLFRAIHVHHGISPDADAWAVFCQRSAEQLGIPCTVEYITLAGNPSGLEAEARDARYRAISRHGDSPYVLLGHHQNDLAESFLLALMRGSSGIGLTSLRAVSKECTMTKLRPLLEVTKSEILREANARHLEWIEDASNQDDVFDRNYLRKHIIPALEKRWPHASQMIHQSISHLSATQDIVSHSVIEKMRPFMPSDDDLTYLLDCQYVSLDEKWHSHLVIEWLRMNQCYYYSRDAIQAILRMSCHTSKSGKDEVIIGNVVVRKVKGSLVLWDENHIQQALLYKSGSKTSLDDVVTGADPSPSVIRKLKKLAPAWIWGVLPAQCSDGYLHVLMLDGCWKKVPLAHA